MSQSNLEPKKTQDVRCKNCHRLLFRQITDGNAEIEIKCEKCKRICKITLPIGVNSNNINLKAA